MAERRTVSLSWGDYLGILFWCTIMGAFALTYMGTQAQALERIAVALEAERAPTEVGDGEAP